MSAQRGTPAQICERSQVERIAHILGRSSAAQMALNEWQRRTDAGEEVVILNTGSSWLVGPDPRLPSHLAPPRRASRSAENGR
jgi:hypothetical protein